MGLDDLEKVVKELDPKMISDGTYESLKLMRTLDVFEPIYQLLEEKLIDTEIAIREKELDKERKKAESKAAKRLAKKTSSNPDESFDDELDDESAPIEPPKKDK